MPWKDFFVELIRVCIWPALIGIVLWKLWPHITKILGRVKKITYKDGSFELIDWSETAKQIEANIDTLAFAPEDQMPADIYHMILAGDTGFVADAVYFAIRDGLEQKLIDAFIDYYEILKSVWLPNKKLIPDDQYKYGRTDDIIRRTEETIKIYRSGL